MLGKVQKQLLIIKHYRIIIAGNKNLTGLYLDIMLSERPDKTDYELKWICKSDVWLTVDRNSVWIRKTN